VSDPSATSSGSSLAVKIDSEKGHPLVWKTVVKRAAGGRADRLRPVSDPV
jgi:hypothetical protein